MIRNLKALGLALIAVFAMSAFAASSAMAVTTDGELTTESGGSVTLDITETGAAGSNALTSFGSTVECPGTTYTGHKYNVTPHEPIPNESTTVTISPKYEEPCTVSGNRQATITKHGCDFVFHVGETTGEGETYGVTADVVCPVASEGITVTVFSNPPTESEGSDLCTVEVTPQTGLAGAHVTNTPASGGTKDDLDVSGTFENIHVERTGLCVFDGKGTTSNAGQFHIDATVKGTDADKEPEGITISH